eukprot:jgi/Tetstr1/456487/TSEL_043210.t1
MKEKMLDGINTSEHFLVFVTKEYARKIASKTLEDNCYYEFHYAHQEKPDKMVFVLVEKEVGLEHWKGYLAPYKSFLSYDMSDPLDQIDESVFRKVAEMLQPTAYATDPDAESASVQHGGKAALNPELMKGVEGLSHEEMEHLAEQRLPEVVFRKLQDSHLSLSNEEQIQCLTGCIAVGAARARQAEGKHVIMFIGNTGAGKSTLVNYLHGCAMEAFKPNPTFSRKVVRVKPGSPKPELMPIGHTNQSKTFIPGIGADDNFTYMDCPGFIDNRGPEINIANAVNIKQAIYAAKSVTVVVLINYYSLLADRGKGLNDLTRILQDLFGSVARLEARAASIALGVSRVPAEDDGDPVKINDIQALLADTSGLPPREAQVVTALRSSLFIAHPTRTLDPEHGWLSRDALIQRLQGLEKITEPSDIFQTVLTPEDERALRSIVEELSDKVKVSMSNDDFPTAAHLLGHLGKIDAIDNALVTRLLHQARDTVRLALLDLRERAVQALLASDFGEAERLAKQLEGAGQALAGEAPGYSSAAAQYVTKVRQQMVQRQEEVAAMDALRRELREGRLQREEMEKRMAELEAGAAAAKADLESKRRQLELAAMEKADELAAAEKAFQAEKARLQEQMEDALATEEEKRRLQDEVARLQGVQEANRIEVEAQAAKREAELRKTLEANERLLAQQEAERASLLAQQREMAAQAEKKLQKVDSALAGGKGGGKGHAEAELEAHEQLVAEAAAKLAEHGRFKDGLAERLRPVRSGGSWSWRFAEEGLNLSCRRPRAGSAGRRDASSSPSHFVPAGSKRNSPPRGRHRSMPLAMGSPMAASARSIHGKRLTVEHVKALAALIGPCPNLDGSWEVLPSLKILNLGGNPISDEGAAALAAALQPRQGADGSWAPPSQLTTLWLSMNSIGDEGAAALAAALQPRQGADGSWAPPSQLTRLSLGSNSIGAKGAAALAAALQPRQGADGSWAPPSRLIDLHLYQNSIGDEGAAALAAALQPRQGADGSWAPPSQLTDLNLWVNSIGDESNAALARAQGAVNSHRPSSAKNLTIHFR